MSFVWFIKLSDVVAGVVLFNHILQTVKCDVAKYGRNDTALWRSANIFRNNRLSFVRSLAYFPVN